MGDSGSTDLDVKGLSLIDFSSENDSLIVSSSSATIAGLNDHQSSETQNGPRSFELLGPVDADKEAEVAHMSGLSEELPQLPETLGAERTSKIGKCNLRKSLAWDSAFFTSAGVLDPEELSGMIEGAEKRKKHMLPGIEEDISRSADSFSTLASDTLMLENPEGDLFEDIRASIQKSHKATNVANSSSKEASAETDSQPFSSSTVDFTSQSKLKTKTALKKQTIGMQGSGKTIKQASGHPQVTQMKPPVRNKNLTSALPKPPKTTGRANPVSVATTKRASLGASRVKFENDNGRVASKGSMASKAPALGSSRGVVPKPALSSKSSSLSSSTANKTQPIRSSSSCDSSGSASSDNIGKSTFTSARRRINTRIVNPTSSGSILKTPSNTALKTRATSGDSALSAYLISSNLSASISPASSISEWSLESSSSSSTVNQRSNKPRASLNTSSCRSLASDVPPALTAKVHSNGQTSDGRENQVTGPGQQTKKASASTKPSGLRMPSPKIGFFDGVKSVVRTPNGSTKSHSGLPTGMAKIGTGICSPNGSGSKAKVGKLTFARTIMPITKMKPDMQTPVSPTPFEEPLNASTKVPNQSTDVRSCPSLSPGVPNEIGGRSCLKAVEVGTEETEQTKHVPDSGLKAVMNANQGVLKIEMSLDAQGSVGSKDIKIVPIEGDTSDSSFNCFIENSSPFQKAGDRKEESLTELSQPTSLSTAPSILKITASRTPFAVKNSSCNSEEIGFSKELSLLALENTATLPSSEIGSKENS